MPSCDAASLTQASACFQCVTRSMAETLEVYLLAQSVGFTGTAADLAKLEGNYNALHDRGAFAALVYLAAQHSGYSTDPAVLAEQAKCLLCLTRDQTRNAKLYSYAANAGLSTDPATLVQLAAPFQGINGSRARALVALMDSIDGQISAADAAAGARCFRCLSLDQLRAAYLYIVCQGVGGVNIVPPGSVYTGSPPEFDVAVNANTTYVIVWGSDDLYVTIGGYRYDSSGAGTQTVVNSGANTVFKFFGTFAGTTVTARVYASGTRIPQPSGFALTINGVGDVIASWDTIPTTNLISYTEVWTSPDGVTWTLASTVSKPTTTADLGAAPATGSTLYAKARFCGHNPLTPCGNYTAPLHIGGRVADWAHRVQVNGGAEPSSATLAAMTTFDSSLVAAALDTKLIALLVMVPDNLIAAITPLYKAAGNDPWTNSGFLAGDVSANGLTGNGAKYLNSGINITTAATTVKVGVAIYGKTFNSQVATDFGGQNSTGGAGFVGYIDLSGSTHFNCPNNSTSQATGAPSGFDGFWCGNRSATNRSDIWAANSAHAIASLANNTASFGDSPLLFDTHPLILFGFNNNGTPTPQAARTFSVCAVFQNFTNTDVSNLSNAMQALRTTLGGAV